MISILVSDLNTEPVARLLRTSKGRLPQIRLVTYADAFRRLSVPAGTLIFSDFDRLSPFERDVAGAIAVAAAQHENRYRVLNHPARAMERFPLLDSLNRVGLNPVEVTRLDTGNRPSRYPVFIRIEDGCVPPDTGLIPDGAAFDAALARLAMAGRSLKGRIAVSFESAPDADGYYRKYGAFCIDGQIVPQHILRDPKWMVKSNRAHVDEAFAAEELAFVRENPHREELARIFDHAAIDFGRIDYTLRDGRIVVFEINTNPTFPRFIGGTPAREERRADILRGLATAFAAIDTPGATGRIRFFVKRRHLRYTLRFKWGWVERKLWERRWQRSKLWHMATTKEPQE